MIENYTVYMHICPNSKKYIGITKMKPEHRWNNGKGYKGSPLFFKAIQKYGWENIKHKILFENLTKEDAEKKEIELIAYFKSNISQFGYNIANGGHINSFNEKTKKIISKKLKGKHNSPNTEFKKGETSPRKGVKLTQEIKNKISKSKKGKKIQNTEKYKKYGPDNPFFEKKHSEETKKKLSLAAKGRISSKRKPVICIETNKKYECIAYAAKELGVRTTSITRVCTGERKTIKKLHYKFL